MSTKYDWRWEDSISTGKSRVDDDEHRYSAFRTNRWLSRFPDTLAHAQEMNLSAHLPTEAQYEYLSLSVTKRRRFARSGKEDHGADLQLVMDHYKYSVAKATFALKILGRAELDAIRALKSEGGVVNDKRVRSNVPCKTPSRGSASR